jgi:hypothetical protein
MEQEQKVTLAQEETEGTSEGSGLGEGSSPWEQQGYSPLDSMTGKRFVKWVNVPMARASKPGTFWHGVV